MKARITLIHKISPRPDQDTEVVDCDHGDLVSLPGVRRLLSRHGYPAPNSKADRRNDDGSWVLFPRDIWHSVIVKEEP